MDEVVGVLTYGLESSLNPFVAAGPILAGLFLRRWWLAVLACVAWAGLVTLVQIRLDTPLTRTPEYVIVARAAVGILVGSALFIIASLARPRLSRDK